MLVPMKLLMGYFGLMFCFCTLSPPPPFCVTTLCLSCMIYWARCLTSWDGSWRLRRTLRARAICAQSKFALPRALKDDEEMVALSQGGSALSSWVGVRAALGTTIAIEAKRMP